jgi:hypothetical protein
MSVSPRLDLPLLVPSQAQKHVTHNEALQKLDALVQLTVESIDATDPPTAPGVGEIHALGPAPTGAWAGQGGQLAYWTEDGTWLFIPPLEGWRAWDRASELLRVHDGTAWVAAASMQNLDGLGIATASDTVNRLAVASEAALFTHAGNDHRLVINKAGAGETGAVVFQSGFSGRAEMGLAGNNDWSIKVSPDGGTWTDALRIAADTGLARGEAVQTHATDSMAGRLMVTGAFGLGGLVPLIGDIGVTDGSIATGFYRYQTSNGSNGAPAPITTAHMLHSRRGSSGGEVQLMIVETGGLPYNTGTVLTRSRILGAWSAWRRLYDEMNVLGPVSQSGGVPTGALMEQVQSPDGTCHRLAGGLQICTDDLTSLSGGDLAWSYPASFAAGTTPCVTVQPVGSTARIGVLVSASPTEATLAVHDLTDAKVAAPCRVTAIGRWF